MKNKIKMKQTAVEWLKETLSENVIMNYDKWDEIFNQAKAMEEQRIKQELEKLKDFEVWKEWKNNPDVIIDFMKEELKD